MSSTDDIILKSLAGEPIFFQDMFAIYPVKLRQIARIGYEQFLRYIQILLLEKPPKTDKTEIDMLIGSLTDFQYLLFLLMADGETKQVFVDAIHFFTGEKVLISEKNEEIIIGPTEEKNVINEGNFYAFQNMIRISNFMGHDEDDIVINDNDDEHVKRLKQQMIENRKKVAKAKSKGRNGKDDLDFSDLVASVALGVEGLNIINIWDVTYYAFNDQLARMTWREQYDFNNRAALAGAKLKEKQKEHWMRSMKNRGK